MNRLTEDFLALVSFISNILDTVRISEVSVEGNILDQIRDLEITKMKEVPDNINKLDEVLINLERKYTNVLFEKVSNEQFSFRYSFFIIVQNIFSGC